MEREKTCFFTGHRQIPKDKLEEIIEEVDNTIRVLYIRGYRSFICGGAIGFDQIAAEAVLRLKATDNAELRLILPCEGQDKFFDEKQAQDYARIKMSADRVEVLYPHYTNFCMHARNRKMADESAACVAYCTKSTGGTAYTMDYAKNLGLEIIRIV